MANTFRLLGVKIDALQIEELIGLIRLSIESHERRIIANHNLHSIYLYQNDPQMRALYQKSDCVIIDSMPLVFIGKLLKLPLSRSHRHTCLDWINVLLKEAESRGWSVFYLGSKREVTDTGMKKLELMFPQLQIRSQHGYFDAASGSRENREVVERINSSQPHILLVGMGMPRQEHWILDNLADLRTNVIIPVGAYLDYIAGAVPTPPRWMGRVGLEWLFRLGSEPRRLFSRYLIEPWSIMIKVLNDGAGADLEQSESRNSEF